jgi:SulP family sulfate permease
MLSISVLWLTPLLEYLPKAVLAAVVMVAVFGLVDVAGARETWRTSRPDFWALAVTFAATLLIGVEPGLAIGLVFSLLVFVARSSTPHATELGRVEGSSEYRNVDRYPTVTHDHVALLRMDGPLFFANTKFLADRMGAITRERPELRDVVLDASAIGAIDASGLHALHELHDDLEASGVHLHLATVRGPVRDALDRSELRQVFDGRIHANLHDAVTAVGGDGCPLCAPDPSETPTAVL